MKTLLISFLLLFSIAYSQSDIPISKYLNEVASGNSDKVRMILPDLMVEYPNDPGVKFLTAAVLSDAMKALDIYTDIVNNSPQSNWADDALYRVIQFNVVLNDENAATQNLELLRKRYPTSEFIVPSADLVKTALGVKADYKAINTANINKDVSPEIIEMSKKPKKMNDKKDDIIIIPNTEKEKPKVAEVSFNEEDPEPEEIVEPELENIDDLAIANNEVNELNDNVEITGKDDIKLKENKEAKDNAEELKKLLDKQIQKEKEAKKEVVLADNTPKKEANPKKVEETKTVEINKKEEKSVRWGLQVAIFDNQQSAETERDKFLSQRMRTEVINRNVDGKNMFAVIVGHYTSKSNAEAAKIIINQQCNCNPLIIEK